MYKKIVAFQSDSQALNYYHLRHHDSRAKIIYEVQSGHQIIRQAYRDASAWRTEVFDTISDCLIRTKVAAKKRGLTKLLNDLILLTDEEIKQKLSQEVGADTNNLYHIHTHADWYSDIFCLQTATAKHIKNLLRR